MDRVSECTHPYHTMGHGLQLVRCEHFGVHFIDEWDGNGYFVMGLHDGTSVNPQYRWKWKRVVGACGFGDDACKNPAHTSDNLIPLAHRDVEWEMCEWLLLNLDT